MRTHKDAHEDTIVNNALQQRWETSPLTPLYPGPPSLSQPHFLPFTNLPPGRKRDRDDSVEAGIGVDPGCVTADTSACSPSASLSPCAPPQLPPSTEPLGAPDPRPRPICMPANPPAPAPARRAWGEGDARGMFSLQLCVCVCVFV